MNLLQTIIPVFYDSHSGPVPTHVLVALIIVLELVSVVWLCINYLVAGKHKSLKERLWCDEDGYFPNAPTVVFIFINVIFGLSLLVVLVAKMIK